MKKVFIPMIALFALALNADAQQAIVKKRHHQKRHMMEMAKQLQFTDAQKAQAKTINTDARKKMQELNKQDNITVKEMRSRKAAIEKDRKTKMDGILTADQKNKLQQLKADRKAKREGQYVKHLDKMKTNLNLSDEQVAQLKEQHKANQAKAQKIKNNESLSREQKRMQLMALKSASKEQHKKIFTAEQLKKMQDLKKNRGNKQQAK